MTATGSKPIHSFFLPRPKPATTPAPPALARGASDGSGVEAPPTAPAPAEPIAPTTTAADVQVDSNTSSAAPDASLGALNGGGVPAPLDVGLPPPTASTSAPPPPAHLPTPDAPLKTAKPLKMKQGKLWATDCDLTLSDGEDVSAKASGSSSASRTTRARRAAKPRASKVIKAGESSDEELVVVASPKRATQAKRGRKTGSVASSSRSAEEADTLPLKATVAIPATRDEPEVIVIPDSPPPRKEVELEPRLDAMRPLGELTTSLREAKKVVRTVDVRWPTAEEHGGWPGFNSVKFDVGKKARWAEGKGKARAVEDDASFFGHLRRQLAQPDQFATSHERPTRAIHSYNSVPSLLPNYPPHPLLDRLAAPLRDPSSSKSSFVRSDCKDAALAQGIDSSKFRDLFTSKYAPKRSDEVLGTLSRRSAGELKAWLEELAIVSGADEVVLGGRRGGDKAKRRPIERGVKQRKRRRRRASYESDDSDLEGFIAPDSDSDDDLLPSDEDRPDEDDSLLPQASASRQAVFPFLTNLILLHGPTGSGKTSAVHAVAQELGWQVFEVWPGTGKRTARDVERYVGDVSKNHTLRGGVGSPRRKGSLFSMFEKKPTPEAPGQGKKERAGEKQSVILIDEVDVLFRDEKDFWPGLVALALSSQRPIVLTCTDTSHVPFDELGLQPVVHAGIRQPLLSFAAPEEKFAVPFLQLVGLAEGHVFPPERIEKLYEEARQDPLPLWYGVGADGGPVRPRRVDEAPVGGGDLRRALMALQFECGWEPAAGEVTEGDTEWSDHAHSEAQFEQSEALEEEEELMVNRHVREQSAVDRASLAADSLSFADAHLARRPLIALHHFEPTNVPSSVTDDLLEFDSAELLPIPRELEARFASAGREHLFAEELAHLGRGAALPKLRRSEQDEERLLLILREKRTSLLSSLVLLSDTLHPYRLPSPTSFTDYLPFAQLITRSDDSRESALAVEAINTAVAYHKPSSLSSSSISRSSSGGGAAAGSTRRSGRLQGLKPYRHRIQWVKEEGSVIRALGMLE